MKKRVSGLTGKFVIVWLHAEGPDVVIATEQQVSEAYNMADCHEVDFRVHYLDDNGALVPVTLGFNDELHANDATGKYIVGSVARTDH